MNIRQIIVIALAGISVLACGSESGSGSSAGGGSGARDYISIVGSSTVFPFSTVVAERFGQTHGTTPTVESTGSGGGFKLFCSGVGLKFPDVTNSSRRIKASEVASCDEAGVTEIVEVKIGYDGIVLANAIGQAPFELSRRDIFSALAKQLPDPAGSGEFIDNPYEKWSDIRSDLPARRIEVLGPPPTSGTRDAFVELAMEGGCSTYPEIAALEESDGDRYTAMCHSIREDGTFIEAGENDNLIVQKLNANPAALGIFGYSFLDQNGDKVQGASIDGVPPSFENISSGSYPVSRPLYFYVKRAHVEVVPGINEFLREYTSDRAWGPEGYLSERGLIPLPDAERSEWQTNIRALKLLDLGSSE